MAILVAAILLLLSDAVSSQFEDIMVLCSRTRNCAERSDEVPFNECCNNRVEPIGFTFTIPGGEGCNFCPTEFGFAQGNLVGQEQSDAYVVEFGFFSGAPFTTFSISFEITGTAGSNDISLVSVPMTFLANEPQITNLSFTLNNDQVALEGNETFSISFTGANFDTGTEAFDQLDGIIIDVTGVTIRFTEMDYVGREGTAAAIPVMVEKDTLIATPLTITVTPQIISGPPANPFAPNLADEDDFNATVITATFLPDEAIMGSNRLSTPIPIFDDDVNEAREQIFLATLAVESAITPGLVRNDVLNVSTCIIIDNDEILISFEFPVYEIPEPEGRVSFPDTVLIIKQGNQRTEQTFNVTVNVGDPIDGTPPATLQGSGGIYDYSLGEAGVSSVTRTFLPNMSSVPFSFIVRGDDATEGTEAFRASLEPIASSSIQLGTFNATQVFILDDDRVVVGFLSQSVVATETQGQARLEIGVISGTLQRDLALQLTLADNSALVNEDYLPSNQIVTLNSVNPSLSVSIALRDDALFEVTESFQATLTFPNQQTPATDARIDPSVANITILDNDRLVFGFDPVNYEVAEEGGSVSVIISLLQGGIGLKSGSSIVFSVATASTPTTTATAGVDYVAVDLPSLLFPSNANSVPLNIAIIPDEDTEANETFAVNLALADPAISLDVEGMPDLLSLSPDERSRILISRPQAIVTIIDNDDSVDVNDTTIGDPFFTVPIFVSKQQLVAIGKESLSLCFEVHGKSNRWFNLITDSCISVNGRFAFLLEGLNIIDELGVRAVDLQNNCVNIKVSIQGCSASVNGISLAVNGRYSSEGISVRRFRNRVRISVPNCSTRGLTMWAVCQKDVPGQPRGEMIKLVVTRGLRTGGTDAHGIFGQFWNIPISVTPFTGTYRDGTPVINRYEVSIPSRNNRLPRAIIGFLYPLDWEGQEEPCIYVGSRQAGPSTVIEGFTDGVLEGSYSDYQVNSAFSEEDYIFGRFNDEKCIIT